jgi:hypothetical protein
MTAPVAAAYMGISQSTFLTRFSGSGVKEGANTFWARAQLDQMIAKQFGLECNDPAGTVYDAWKAAREK